MKKTTSKLLIAAAITSISMSANADNSWYVGASLSSVDVDTVDTTSTQQVGGVSRNLNLDSDSDTGVGLKIGKTVLGTSSGYLDVELNYSQSDHDIDTIQFQNNVFTNGRAEGDLEVDSLFLRAAYRFKTGSPFQPYVGLGLGIVDVSVDARYGGSVGSASQSRPPFANGSDEAVAFEIRTGVQYNINKKWAAFAEYSYRC